MSDLNHRLSGLLEEPATTDLTVAEDLRRGRTARLRRTVRMATATVAVLAVAGVGAAITLDREPAAPHAGGPAGVETATGTPAENTPAATQTTEGIDLVAWTGEQPAGFRVAVVPEGFVLQGASESVLSIARPDDTTDIYNFENKIVVTLDANGMEPHGEPVQVGDYQGWLHKDGATQMLTVQRGDQRLEVQAWGGLGLSDEQVLEFAQGVTITEDAVGSVG